MIHLPTLPTAPEMGPVLGRHNLAAPGGPIAPDLAQHNARGSDCSELFDDHALTSLLDDPEQLGPMRVHTTGPSLDDWQDCDRSQLDGAQLLELARRRPLWINVIDIGRRRSRYADMLRAIEAEFAELAPVDEVTANLLISSPDATVNFHVDPEPNLLLQLRGRKRVYVYPAHDTRFCRPDQVAAICSGTVEEELPYEPSFDDAAQVFELEPGDVLAWPQHSPHRIENIEGLNVTLSVSWHTPDVRHQMHLYASHHGLTKRPLGHWLGGHSNVQSARVLAFRSARRIGLLKRHRPPPRAASVVLQPASGIAEQIG